MIRLALISRSMTYRAGLRALLQEDGAVEVRAEAASHDELPPWGIALDAWVVAGGLAALDGLQDVLPREESLPALLLLSDDAGAAARMAAFAPRAWGVLPLEATAEEITAAIHALAQGLVALTPQALSALGLPRPPSPPESAAEPLTERETQVLQLLAQGQANKQIAAALGISEHTVKFHVSSIFAKLNAASRTAAVRLGVQQGLIAL
ncbi:MAG: response regulator transcription factor [Chloroflexi bacterium]|nr:response regulator transcription factor [Chloroflexota bacterium]